MRSLGGAGVALLLALVAAGGCSAASGGTAAPTPITRVVGLGDSVPSGAACGCPSFVTLVAQQWQATHGLGTVADNRAVSGLTTPGLLAQVSAERLVAAPGTATLITVGANDFSGSVLSTRGCRASDAMTCYAPTLSTMRTDLLAVLSRLMAVPRHGPVVVTGYWNVFLDGPVGDAKGPEYVRDSDALTRQVNDTLAAASRSAGAIYVDLWTPFNSVPDESPLLAADGDHPSAAGHEVIAAAIVQALERVGV